MSKKAASSVEEFAERYGICRATVYNEIKRGRLATLKIGARTVITGQQEADYLKNCSRVAASDVEISSRV